MPKVPNQATDEIVKRSLKKILESEIFSSSERLCRFLTLTVQETLKGRGNQLNQYLIGVEVFDKPKSFDPTIDPVVRVEAGRLRSKLSLYYSTEGRADPIKIVIPKGGYKTMFESQQQPPAGSEQKQEIGDSPELAQPSHSDEAASPGDPAIAVLPFMDLTPERDQEWFCDGLTEEIISALTAVEGIRVAARSSSFSFKGKTCDVREIGKKLNVNGVLEGGVRMHDSRLRVTAQFNSVNDGYVLWAGSYTEELREVMQVQEQISKAVAVALGGLFHASPGGTGSEPN